MVASIQQIEIFQCRKKLKGARRSGIGAVARFAWASAGQSGPLPCGSWYGFETAFSAVVSNIEAPITRYLLPCHSSRICRFF